ncbi:vesicle coat protein [Schizosaccharomyces japonicus yFS275]|uniref:Vesicle coat protein n=1 Tax=Schizosaccharomyces japonicus (strain yFS275 / FY16936) TaxID=402676 RepID=B6K1W8_SCHJY|nr:vesicle coat protein [Schizosaccharomyces japonicus yFS275]EEB07149.2 vesicle coat protein [Schizosaccharomyces japonicus yFS275]
MDVILALGHFCEIEGPSIMFCTQKLCPNQVPGFDCSSSTQSSGVLSKDDFAPTNMSSNRSIRQDSSLGSSSDFTVSPVAANGYEHYEGQKLIAQANGKLEQLHLSSNNGNDDLRNHGSLPETHIKPNPPSPLPPSEDQHIPLPVRQRPPFHTHASVPLFPSSRPKSSSCASCNIVLPECYGHLGPSPRLCSWSSSGEEVLISTQYPHNQLRYSLLRQAVVRCLSCEYAPPSDSTNSLSSPIFFGDNETGFVLAQPFTLPDPIARGGRRRYVFLALSPLEDELIVRYHSLTKQLLQLALAIRQSAYEHVKAESTPCHSSNPSGSSLQSVSSKHPSSSTTPNGGKLKEDTSSSMPNGGVSVPRRLAEGANHKSTASTSSKTFCSLSTFNFLRRRDEVGEKNFADVTGLENIFISIHCAFSAMLDTW